MRWITNLGGARVTVAIPFALLAFGARQLGVAVAVALTLSHIAVQVLKRAVARPRPCDANGHPLALIELPDPFSFPSGHAAASMAVAGAISVSYPLAAPALLTLAGLVAYSRVALRVHHLGDVIAGAALGAAGVAAASVLL